MSLHNDNALVVALDTSTDMLACAASWIDGRTGETKLVSGDHMCRRHANVELVNTVDGVLAQAGLDRSDVGCYVVGLARAWSPADLTAMNDELGFDGTTRDGLAFVPAALVGAESPGGRPFEVRPAGNEQGVGNGGA